MDVAIMVENSSIGKALKRYRSAADISATELARRAGLSPATVIRIEHNQVCPSATTVTALAEALQVTPNDLLDGHSRLPDLAPYLRARYSHLPIAARREITDSFRRIAGKYGFDAERMCPRDGEDEEPPSSS
jgi:transcriptional regulator with XRE-family HTH domain